MAGLLPEDYCNKGPLQTPTPKGRKRDPTYPSLMTTMSKNIAYATKSSLILFQVPRQVVFHSDEPSFSPPVTTVGARWPALPAGTGAALVAHTLTKTAQPDTITAAAIRSGKKIQTAHDQLKFHTQQPDYPPTPIYLARVTETQIMLSWKKIWPQDRPTRQNLRDISKNSNRCKKSPKQI